jgi:hypothetical protein
MFPNVLLRWEYAMGPDHKLQTEEYRNSILQQGRTRADHKHKASVTTSFLDRIQGLYLVRVGTTTRRSTFCRGRRTDSGVDGFRCSKLQLENFSW